MAGGFETVKVHPRNLLPPARPHLFGKESCQLQTRSSDISLRIVLIQATQYTHSYTAPIHNVRMYIHTHTIQTSHTYTHIHTLCTPLVDIRTHTTDTTYTHTHSTTHTYRTHIHIHTPHKRGGCDWKQETA